MSLLRGLGQRLRRDENVGDNVSHGEVFSGALKARVGAQLPSMGGGAGAHDEPPDLYYEDRALGSAVRALEDVRGTLRALARAANDRKDMLVAGASAQRALGAALVEAVEGGGTAFEGDEYAESGGEEEEEDGPVARFLSLQAIDAQKTLGHSLVAQSGSMIKLGVAFCNPIEDLQTSFEERVVRKIVPLRRRYLDQKTQYLRYMRQSDAAEEDEKRSYFDALAQAAKPVWVRTSKELRTEAHIMTQLTARNIAKWSKGLALQHERSLAIAAANYSDAFTKAKALNK